MDISKAKEIILNLHDGINPFTGEICTNDDLINNPEMKIALLLCLKGLDKLHAVEERLSKQPKNSGRPWSTEEESLLIERFKCGYNIENLALLHERTEWAIESRLLKNGLLNTKK